MQTKYKPILMVIVCIGVQACTSLKPYYDKSMSKWESLRTPDTARLKYSIFLIGDAGKPDDKQQEPVLKLLQSQLFHEDEPMMASTTAGLSQVNNSRKEDVVIFLGDNIYETGLPQPDASDRKEKERRIIEQMKVVKDFKGQKIFIPGNHDWNESLPGGLQALNREEEFVEQYLDSADVFLPSSGCGGPVEIQMNKDLVIIVIDSEWWLSKYEKPLAPDNGCTVASRLDVLQQIQDIVVRNRGKNIVLAQHHPLFSNGRHGGYFTLKDFLFPLTLIRDNLYIPLPVVGALYPLLRLDGVSRQDLSNKDYQQLKKGLLTLFEDEKNVAIVTGHEHALQFNKYNDVNHIISGAGSKSTSLVKGHNALFSYGGGGLKGFARLNYYTNGQCWLEFWTPEGDGSKGKVVFRTPLYTLPSKAQPVLAEEKYIDYKDSIKLMPAGSKYQAGSLKRSIFGEHYRDTWATPIRVNYLDLNNFAGGLAPVKMGGGHQTTSLQLKGKDGNLYQFRTIDKNPSALLPEGFRKTFAEDIVQDQISSAHPYGALIIPEMARSVGIYHTNPQLVYMPNSSLLNPYRQQIGGRLGLIEVRPDENLSDFKSFGNTQNAISTAKMYKELREDNDNEVDQKMFLKSRLFDMLIGDWDRHEDQWRWAEFKKDKGKILRPIPRDRDQAFSKFDGLLPGIMKSVLPDIQSFTPEIKDPAKLSIAARNLDRNLLNKLSREDWKIIATEMQDDLTDEIISKAVSQMPAEVYAQTGQEIIRNLKNRRDQLVQTADNYYSVLAREVRVAGSDKKEFFKVEQSKDSTLLTIHKIDKSGTIAQKLYDRRFNNQETTEISLFGLDGQDSILVEGTGASGPKIRVVGGAGKDALIDKSSGARTVFYDQSSENNYIESAGSTKLQITDKDWVNEYKENFFTYDKSGIRPALSYNADDRIFIGGGYAVKHYGFRKDPYSYDWSISGIYAPKTSAYSLRFKSTFYSLLGHKTDVVLNSSLNGPKYTFNYYGQGNSSLNVGDDIDFFRVRTRNFSLSSFVQYRYSPTFKVGIGPGYEYYRVEKPARKYITSPAFPEKDDIANASNFLTLRSYAFFDFLDNQVYPTSGIKIHMEGNYFNELTGNTNRFLQLKSEFAFYVSPVQWHPATIAFRLGGATNIGDYKFFQANSLGNNSNLRGYRNNRFSGRSDLFFNAESRFKFFNFRNYIFTGSFGMFAFFDTGKVFSDQPETRSWHKSYGPGAWINLYQKFLISTSYGISREGKYFTIKGGLFF